MKTVAAVPENFTYVDQDFPSLFAASTVATKVDPKLSTEDKSVKTTSREPSMTRPLENVKPEPTIAIKKQHSPWKKPSESLQPVSLLAFMPQSVTKQDLTTNHHSITHNPVAQSETRSMTTYEDEIDTKLCEIILTIHQLHEYVSLERVEKELFEHYKVNSFRELRVNPRHLKTLTNLSHRVKDVTFYMQIFEQIFNLCTLHDLDPLLAKFLKFDTYEEAHLGPLDKNPDVQRVFQYKPRKRRQSIPDITSGQIIDAFIAFKDKHRRHERYDYNGFIAELLQQNQLHKKEELGIYCKSFPYLSEISGKVTQDYKKYTKRVETDAQKQIIRTVETRLWEIQREVSSELNLSAYIDKLPIAVFDHLVSIVDKHLTVTQQKLVRDTLMDIRDNELLRCLLNISIYLGTIDQPEEFIAELKKLNQHQKKESEKQDSTALSSSHVTTKSMNSKNQRKEQQHMADIQNSDTTTALTRPSIETSFGNSSSSSIQDTPHVSLNQLCSDMFKILMRYDTVLTLKQLSDVKKHVCDQYSLEDFSEFGITDDNSPLDMISFLNMHRNKIDPNKELAIYENNSSSGDRHELYSFVNQLTVINNWREQQPGDQYSSSREIPLSKDQLSAVEKAIQHKFSGVLTRTSTSQIIKRTKKHFQNKPTQSLIRFEESLLDEVNLNRLNMCPSSLLVDESQLCKVILQCPIMNDLPTWLQWSHFFQSRYGQFKMFIARKQQELDGLLVLETSNHELLRLPIDSSFEQFENELNNGNVSASVGHLCSLIIYEYVQVNRMPLNIYRQVMTTWFIRLRSSAQLQRDQKEPMQYILEFLIYLPTLIGQSRIVQELILDPLDEVFSSNEDSDEFNPRERIWMLADRKQKSKLEAWAYLLDIDEWKNENKWRALEEIQEEIDIQQPNHEIQNKQTCIQDIIVPTKVQLDSLLTIPSSPVVVTERLIPVNNNTNINDSSSCSAAYEHIKKIREGFGVDSSLDAAGQSIVNNLKGVLERSLEKLSNDLYSEQGHFVLELIQNADDNHYSSDCLPTLRFIVSSDRILVCNNEIGFQPDNVTAICNVGKSTKGKHKQGYTGHKGIGFKSVFMVSHRPEIHSGDYHFCFDTDLGKEQIGYIRPIWLEQSEELLPSASDWTTCIRLPVKMDKRGNRLKRNFDDIHARLLLFLNRLRQIEIVREKDNHKINTRTFTRIDHANGQIIELQERTTTSENILRSFWLVVKTTSKIPLNIKRQLNDVKGDIESTIIAIAYPLDAIHESSSYAILPSQPLFAYLPLRSYGFRFILQGDLEIPASRQEVLRDNIWNEWLKKEMIQLLPTAYDLFKNLPKLLTTCSIDVQKHIGSLDSMETLKYFIKMLPTQNDLDPYFNSFIDKAIKGLMGCIQLPIISEKDQENIQWISPTQCVFVRDSFIRQIFTSDLLLSHFNNYYLNEQFVNECDENILIKLGCRRLDFSTILKLIKTLYTQNDQEYSTKTTTIEQIAQWFLCIDYSFQQERDQPDFNYNDNDQNEITTMDQLKQMKIIPLQQQTRLVSIEEMKDKAIFFPLDKSTEFAKYLKLVAEGLPTIDERLMEYIEKKYPRRLNSIKDLLKKLGISEFRQIRRIYANHVLPIMADEMQWKTKSDSVLIAYLIFIYKDLYSLNPAEFANDMKKLRNQLIIKTQQGNFIRINSNETDIVHLTSLYGSQTSLDLLKLFPNRFQFISNDYLIEYQKELFYHAKERLKFNYFLNELDLHGFFLIKKKDERFIKVEELVNTQWSSEIQTLSLLIFEPFIIEDNCSDELDTLIMSKDSLNANQYFEILRYLDYTFKFFGSYYASSVIRARDRHTGATAPVHGVASSLCLSLRKHSWIPVSDGQSYKPSDVYYLPVNNPFRRYVPCLDPSIVRLSDMNFVQILGFKQEISHMTMFELLMKWSCNLDSDMLWKLINMTDEQDSNPIPCTISTQPRQLYHDTLQNIQNIYLFISMDEEIRRLLARFRLWPLIFIPRTDDIGEFVFVDEVFWEDPLALLTTIDVKTRTSNQHIALQPYYNNNKFFQQFFFEILQIKQGPTLDDYLLLLSDIKKKTFDYIWKCINVITQLAFTDNKQTLVKDTTINWSFIPCINNGNELVKYTDRPYYPHDMIVVDLFSDVIRIIKLPDNLIHSIEFKQQFCTLFNIDDLANVIKVLVNVDNRQPARELHEFYSHSIELIQDYLISNGLLPETRSCCLQSIFSKMNFLLVDCIYLSYQYGENLIRKAPLPSTLNSYIDESTSNFYILQKYAKNENYHIDTIVDYLIEDVSARLQLSQFIQELYKSYEQHGVENLIKQREILPDHNISKWIIPQIMKSELNSSSIKEKEKEEEEDDGNNEIITYTPEMLQRFKDEPGWQPKKPTTKPILDPDQPKPLICIPSTAGATLSNEALNKEHSAKSDLQLTDVVRERATSANVHESSEQTVPRDREKHSNETTTTNKTFEGSTVSHTNSVTLADFTPPQPSINFELIQISNFTDIALIPTTLSDQALPTNLNLPNNETDSIIGRRGEDFVYRYLLWKHPDAQIQWNNQQNESGQPFDIKLIRNENKKQTEFIEVKTTRVPKQNTFQISIGEIECLLQNQNNYYIYRVYYNDEDEKLSTITILSRIKCHLQQKQLTLSITIAEKLDEQ
ncbi:unnamed protein product [Adineta steineri]|uniref:Protein NO VEIN C-terminal domain-containing protein n=1 Tax=Adineta steineri TaxID=433720 RepID=A0A815WT10_9BILA|nr:unnamed protein product [Adineta steineri]CAF1547152.1 unnamed protein product [Adineta steineri]